MSPNLIKRLKYLTTSSACLWIILCGPFGLTECVQLKKINHLHEFILKLKKKDLVQIKVTQTGVNGWFQYG